MDAIIFDLDDTIYDQAGAFVRTFHELYPQKASAIDFDAFWAAFRIRSDEVFRASQDGAIAMDSMHALRVQRGFADMGLVISKEDALAFQDCYAGYLHTAIALTPTMVQVLDWCKDNAAFALLTNGPSDHQRRKLEQLGLGRWFGPENTFISGDYTTAKPDPEFYLLAAAGLGADPMRTVYCGDSFANDVVGPTRVGMRTIWFNRHGRTRPAEPSPTWTVDTEEELLALLPTIA